MDAKLYGNSMGVLWQFYADIVGALWELHGRSMGGPCGITGDARELHGSFVGAAWEH